jgi:hypothetical protein
VAFKTLIHKRSVPRSTPHRVLHTSSIFRSKQQAVFPIISSDCDCPKTLPPAVSVDASLSCRCVPVVLVLFSHCRPLASVLPYGQSLFCHTDNHCRQGPLAAPAKILPIGQNHLLTRFQPHAGQGARRWDPRERGTRETRPTPRLRTNFGLHSTRD